MNRAYRVFLSQKKFKHLFNYEFDGSQNVKKEHKGDCQFYYGEPVTVNGKRGFIENIVKKEGEEDNEDPIVQIRIKLKKGFYTNEIKCSKIIKEIYKKSSNLNIEEFLNRISQNNNNKRITTEDKVSAINARASDVVNVILLLNSASERSRIANHIGIAVSSNWLKFGNQTISQDSTKCKIVSNKLLPVNS